jgi:hypothetical protein
MEKARGHNPVTLSKTLNKNKKCVCSDSNTTVAHFPEITSALPYQRPDYSKDLIYRPHKPRIFYSERDNLL